MTSLNRMSRPMRTMKLTSNDKVSKSNAVPKSHAVPKSKQPLVSEIYTSAENVMKEAVKRGSQCWDLDVT